MIYNTHTQKQVLHAAKNECNFLTVIKPVSKTVIEESKFWISCRFIHSSNQYPNSEIFKNLDVWGKLFVKNYYFISKKFGWLGKIITLLI